MGTKHGPRHVAQVVPFPVATTRAPAAPVAVPRQTPLPRYTWDGKSNPFAYILEQAAAVRLKRQREGM